MRQTFIIRIIKKFCDNKLSEGIIGDLEELFLRDKDHHGNILAQIKLHWRALGFFRGSLMERTARYNSSINALLRNYTTLIIRKAFRNRLISGVNLLGLTLGFSASAFIILFIYQEYSYDRHFQDHERIYRLALDMDFGDQRTSIAVSPSGFGNLASERLPGVENYAMLRRYTNFAFKKGDEFIGTEYVYMTNPDMPKVFDYDWLSGDPKTALTKPNSIVLTASMASRLFERPMDIIGKSLQTKDNENYTITGLIADPIPTSHFHPEVFVSLSNPDDVNKMDAWRWCTYVKMESSFSYEELPENLETLSIEVFGKSGGNGRGRIYIIPQPLADIHFISKLDFEMEPNEGSWTYVYGFAGILVLLLTMCLINYINLTASQSLQRIKEVGIRKTFGARLSEIKWQFLFESFLYVLTAFILGGIILWQGQNLYTNYTGIEWEIKRFNPVWVMLTIAGSMLLMSLVAGIYPAFYLARITKNIKSSERNFTSSRFQSVLVFAQLSFCILVVTGSFVFYQQIDFMSTKSLGFNKHQVITLKTGRLTDEQSKTLKNEINAIPGVEMTSHTEQVPGTKPFINNFEYETENGTKKIVCPHLWADDQYLEILDIPLIAGKSLDLSTNISIKNGVLVNQAFVKQSGWTVEEAIGQSLKSGTRWEGEVIGVVEDFHFTSLHNRIEPTVIRATPSGHYLMIRYNGENTRDLIYSISQKWGSFSGQTAEINFLDKHFEAQYQKDNQRAELFLGFTALIIIIGISGLFGTTSFLVQQKMKEMSIRKIHGASMGEILKLMMRKHSLIGLTAAVFSIPLTYLILVEWLENFAYTISLGPISVILPGFIMIAIAIFIVGIRSFKVALINPAKILRDE